MADDEFERLLDQYLDAPVDRNPRMEDISIDWIDDDPKVGALHIWEKHKVTKEEVEQVLFEIPPMVEAKRSRKKQHVTYFWGATSQDRWLFVACEDWREGNVRYLRPITAFEPDDGERYWREQ